MSETQFTPSDAQQIQFLKKQQNQEFDGVISLQDHMV